MIQASNVMNARIAGVHPKASLGQAIELMADLDVGGLPVIDVSGMLVGMLTGGDLLRRTSGDEPMSVLETFLFGTAAGGALDKHERKLHERLVEEVMTPELCTVQENTCLMAVARLMKGRGIKRLPVMRGDKIVGMIYRAGLDRLLGEDFDVAPLAGTDQESAIKDAVIGTLHTLKWTPCPLIDVSVDAGMVELQGTLLKQSERAALRAAIETIPGVTSYTDHLALAEVPRDMFPHFADDMVWRPKLFC